MLERSFYRGGDVVAIARQLLGKVVYTSMGGVTTAGIITETEAYHQNEKACHAYMGRKTNRTDMLFREGGVAYVYLCYGIHHLFNIVTGPQGVAEAVLIRGVLPHTGLERMLMRRNMAGIRQNLSSGPGTLSQALGITTSLNGCSLEGPSIWLEDEDITVEDGNILVNTRIGVDYAGEDALLPWRFNLEPALIQEYSQVLI